MSSVKFKNIRFDADSTLFHNFAKQMAKAFGYTADLALENKLAQLLRLRVAQKNESAYCVILHAKTSREIEMSEEITDNIASWYNRELFSTKEKLSLAYCDALTEVTKVGFQKYNSDLTQYFLEVEIAEIAAVVINMNIWTHLKLARGEMPYSE